MKEVYIIAAKRTPIGGFLGSLSHLSATELGATVIKDVYLNAGIDPNNIDSVYMGNVLSANLGQSPARQSAIFAGIPNKGKYGVASICNGGGGASAIVIENL